MKCWRTTLWAHSKSTGWITGTYQRHHYYNWMLCCSRFALFTSQTSAYWLHRISHATVAAHSSEASKKGSVFNERVVISYYELSLSFTGYCSFHNFIIFWACCQRPTGYIHSSKLNIREHPQALEHNLYHQIIRMISGTVLNLANWYAPKKCMGRFPRRQSGGGG